MTKEAFSKKKGTLYFILGSFKKDSIIFITYYEEQFRKMDAHFS